MPVRKFYKISLGPKRGIKTMAYKGSRRSQLEAVLNNSVAPTGEKIRALTDIVNGLSNDEIRAANPNIQGNPLYGYGGSDVSFPDISAAMGAYAQNSTPEEQAQLAREVALLRNANDYRRQQNLNQFVEDERQRNLYGDTLVDLLQNSPQGQSILDSIPAKNHRSRERNVTGSAKPGFDDYWSLTGLNETPAQEKPYSRKK